MSAQWPSAVVTTSQLYIAVNELQNNLSGAINAAVTTIGLNSTTSFPTVGLVLIDNEVMQYTGISGNNLTGCTRAFDGTSAASHSSGATVSFAFCAAHYNNAANEVIAVETYLDTVLGKGTTVTAAEFARLSGVTSAIQTQLNAKAPLASPTFTGTITTPLTASRVVTSNGSSQLAVSTTTTTEIDYVHGVTSAIQTQLDSKIGGTNQPVNILINGGFDIWQRNTTFSAPSTLAYTADRWQINSDETANVTITKETTTVDASAASMKVVVASTGASHFYRLRQKIENALELAGKTVVVSLRVNTSVASAIKVGIGDQSAIQAESSYHTGGGGWETLSVSYTFASNITEATIYLGMLDAGDKKNGTYYFDNAMFCFGSTAISFVPKATAQEWTDCQRYYFKTFDPATAPAQNTGISVGALAYSTIIAGANQNSTTLTYPVRMRTVPTITTYSIGAATSAWWNVSRGQASGAATVLFNSSTSCVSIRNAQAAGDVAGDAAGLHVTADAEM